MQLLRTAVFLLFCAASALAATSAHPPAQRQLANGAPSVDALLDRLLAALAARDEQGLHRLRVTEHEYRDIIIPGTVKPGAAPRHVDETTSLYFWRMLDQKSRDVGYVMLQRFGGKQYVRKELKFTKGVREFGGYKALGEVRMEIADKDGTQETLPSGYIAEVNGRYKFIGFNFNS
ncbi:MAG TPA: hypothetical protein VMW56_26295 [Candidatus Margulisiibacteriota bacterium]|nr:hypothetical protein [Candidatus Margulisiibacteriota bacterium]